MPLRPSLAVFSLAFSLTCALPLAARAADATTRFSAITAYEEGRFADVLTLLTDATSPELSLLKARAAAELGRFDEALEALGDTSEFPPDVQADLAHQRRLWAARAGRCDLLATPEPGDPKHVHARCAVSARDFARAETLLKDAKDVEGRVLLLTALVGLGQNERARKLARKLYVEEPAHNEAERFADVLRESDGNITLTTPERLLRAEKLIQARRLEEALRELDSAGEPREKAYKARHHHLRGVALFRMRNRYAEASKAFERAVKLKGETEAYDAFHAVRALSRAGNDKAAIPRYRAFARQYPKSEHAPNAVYLAAWLSARTESPKAREELARFTSSEFAKRAPRLKQDALWDLAYHALGRRDGADAEHWLSRYEREVTRPLDKARAAYWRGRAAALRRDKKAAMEHYLRTLSADVLGYYAQLAARRLKELGEPPPSPFSSAALAFERPELSAPPGVQFYAKLGLADDAARLAEPWVKSLKGRTEKIAAWLAAGNIAKAHVAAEPLLPEVLSVHPENGASWLWRAILPMPYLEAMEAATRRYELDLDEVYAHMQVESRYQPRAISGADALGLLQLLPSTAFSVAKGLGKSISRPDILVPSINIELGTKFLSSLVREHQGQLPLAIAAYNAGSPRVRQWSGKRLELDHWVEQIPIEQTRNYVRRVLGAWSRYRAMRHPDDPWGLPLPTHVGGTTD